MAKFMFVYRGGGGHPQEMSPEQMQQVMQAWMTWIQGGMEAGWMVDGGDALNPQGKVVSPDGTVTDGPFAETKEQLGGFYLIEAKDLDEAIELAAAMPIGSGSLEIRPVAFRPDAGS